MAAGNTGVNKINMVPALIESCHPAGKANAEQGTAGLKEGVKREVRGLMHVLNLGSDRTGVPKEVIISALN